MAENNLSSSLACPNPKRRYTPLVKKSEPTTTVTGQKNNSAEIWVITNAEIKDNTKTSLSKFFSKDIDQKPCRNIKKELTKINPDETKGFCLIESMASNTKNEVTRVKTKPTPLAALNSAMFLNVEDTV